MRRLILTLILLPLFVNLNAQAVDIVTTKTGDIFEGFISKQIPGKELSVYSFKAILTVSRHDAELMRRHKVMLGDLPEKYAPLFPYLSDDSSVEIADVVVTKDDGGLMSFKRSVIIQEGEDVKFASFVEQSFDLKWSQIGSVEKLPYDFSQSSGIVDKLIMPDAGMYEGQLMEQNLVTGLFKFRTADGSIMSLRKSEVQAIRFEPVNQDLDIWSQTPYCDRVNLKDGSSLDGFIQSKVFGKYITMLNKSNGEPSNINVLSIASYEKYPNPSYEEPKVVVVEEKLADLYINGLSAPTSQLVKNKSSYYVNTCVDSLKISSKVYNNIVIKYKTKARTSDIRIAKAKLKKEKVFGLSGISFKKKRTELWPVFTYKDILSGQGINFQSNDGDYIVADITFKEPGVYVIWAEGSEECIPINVKRY